MRLADELSAKQKARIAGALYLVVIVGGLFAEVFVRQKLIVYGDAAATARSILEHETLYRVGFATGLIYLACNLPLLLIFYGLFKQVGKNAALLLVFFFLVGHTVEVVNLLNHYAPLDLLSGGSHLSVFSEEQLHALAYLSLEEFATGFGVSLVFFGFYCILIGYLIFRSGFLPRILGVMMVIAGVCYMTNSFSIFLTPALAAHLFPYILLPCFVAELSLALWLVAMGVSAPKREEQASAGI